MRRACILMAAVLAGWAAPARSTDRAGTESVFVLGAGSRSLAMGRTGAALASDATSLFWNAARLDAVPQSELLLFRTRLFADGVLYHAGFLAYPTVDTGTFAVGYQRLDVSDIEQRGPRNELLGSFDNSESNLLVGYGRSVGSAVSIGGALRIVQQSVASVSDVGFGVDIGAALERPLDAGNQHRIFLGANVRNALEPRVRLEADEVTEPRSLKLGAAYSTSAPQGFAWSAAADVDLPRGTAARFGAGGEVVYAGILALRGGVDTGHPTFGVGVAWRGISADYALRADDELSRNDRFTLTVRFGQSVEKRREERRAQQEQQVLDQLGRLLRERESQERAHTLARADSALDSRDFDLALKLYRRVLAFEPDSLVQGRVEQAELRVALREAEAELRAGRAAPAAAAYQEILDRWPQQVQAMAGLEEARALLQQSADRERQLNDLLRETMTRLTSDDLLGAEMVLSELLRLEPNHALGNELMQRVGAARRTKGQAQLEQARKQRASGDISGALRQLESARRLLGDSAELMALNREWHVAERAAARIEDTTPPQLDSAAPAFTVRPRLSQAERRQLDQRYQEGLEAFQLGNFDRAIDAWKTVWAMDPDFEHVSDYLVKATLYQVIASYSSGRYEEAIGLCRKVLAIDPNNDKAGRYLARIQEEKRELEQIEGGGR